MFLDHTAALGGGELALVELAASLDAEKFEPLVILFARGPLLALLAERGVGTRVFELDPGIAEARKDNLRASRGGRVQSAVRALVFCAGLARLLRTLRPDVVHCNSLKADVLGGAAARLAGCKVIFHLRDRLETDYLPPTSVRLMRLAFRLAPHAVAANSESTLQTVGLPPGRLTRVIYSGVSPRILDYPYNRASMSSAAPVVGMLGRFAPWKGQHVFLEAACSVLRTIPDARFLLAGAPLFGEADYETTLRDMAAQPPLSGRVVFTGFRDDIPAYLSELDVLVHASSTPEPFGQVVVQGMAAGLPVVATRGGGVSEIVQDGLNGRLVPMGDSAALARAILDYASDPDAALLMGARARQEIERRFTFRDTARAAESLYDAVLRHQAL